MQFRFIITVGKGDKAKVFTNDIDKAWAYATKLRRQKLVKRRLAAA
jgi:hypothetical protein